MPEKPALLWFRHDLRLGDHRALTAAVGRGGAVLPVFIWDPAAATPWEPGGASRWWLDQSLRSLARELDALGTLLVLRRGDTVAELTRLAEETGASAVYCSRGYEPWAARLEQRAHTALAAQGVALKRYGGTLLAEPEELRTKAGDPFRVYTPFWRALSTQVSVPLPLARPRAIKAPAKKIASDRLEDWKLLPEKPDWAGGLREAWQPGEPAALARLADFADGALSTYHEQRNRPDHDGTSRLSPHLHFGEVSPAQCWHAAVIASERSSQGRGQGCETFLKELVWREFSYHLLTHWPQLPEEPFRPEFAAFPWAQDASLKTSWQRGRTGYPIVDAGMRQLWHTGWMHNRVRMIVASFLIKDLLIPWQEGEAWFWDTLVDADLASNAASWQWVAGSGADAAPYFRIFNPVTQGQKFDPSGAYVRRWVPELSELPDEHVHAPWTAPAGVLAAAGVELGRTYPLPIVDHAEARTQALAGYQRVKAAGSA